MGAAIGLHDGFADIRDGLKSDTVQTQHQLNIYNVNNNVVNASSSSNAQASAVVNNTIDFQGVVNSMNGVQYAINQQGQLIASSMHDIAYAIQQPRLTETHTNGQSWGGAQTTTHTDLEQHTLSDSQAFTTGDNWSTAYAVDSSHAANLTFNYTVKNTGTDYAAEISGMIFNVYLGDDANPIISYPAWQQFPSGKLQNVFPGNSFTFASNPVPLTLDQMRRIDLGEHITVILENYSYGVDQVLFQNAVQGGVTVYAEGGADDASQKVDSFVIPTWGTESVQDVLARYFPTGYDADRLLNSLSTPDFTFTPTKWHEHALSDISWWNIYQTCNDPSVDPADCQNVGSTPLRDQTARAGSSIFLRFNRDSDRDGYPDRTELQYGTDPHDPASHPTPELLAGYASNRVGNVVTVTMALENTGNFDVNHVSAVMFSPDGTTTIGNNTVGGNGRVRANQQVAVGSLVKQPALAGWGISTAKPYAIGDYSGDVNRTYFFTVTTPGTVGQGSAAMVWNNGTGVTGTLDLGLNYHAPLPIDLSNGLQVGLDTGVLASNAYFTVTTLSPQDTFTYTVNSDPYTEPVILVTFSDPQGAHRFITPIQVPSLGTSLAPTYTGQMLKNAGISIEATGPVTTILPNVTDFVINNPSSKSIQGGHLYADFVSNGNLVLHLPYTITVDPGPMVFTVTWSTSVFSQTYDPTADNILVANWTDRYGNIIDSKARPLNTFASDPKPTIAMNTADQDWNFGTATQGTLLKRTFTFGNVGLLDLLTYINGVPGLSLSQTGSRVVGPADATTYEMALNTSSVAVGPYDQTITIRSSDPAQPTQTVRIHGTVTTGVSDVAGGSSRPLDVDVTVTGNQSQGTWWTYSHSLGPNPNSLHPVKVYDGAYSQMWGVGKYATDFAAGTASGVLFGDGRDGVMPSSGNLDYNNGFGAGIVNSGNVGSYNINIADVYASWRIQPGDVVLIHQTQGSGSGCWELNKAISDSVGGTETLQVAKPLKCSYSSGGTNRAQILRVPQYTTCNVAGTVTPLAAWNGSWGGIFAVMCNGTMNLSGVISASGYGYRGASRPDNAARATGKKGESYDGSYNAYATTNQPNYSGGGGAYNNNADAGSGGGGGGYASVGGTGELGHDTNGSGPGVGGDIAGIADLTALSLFGGGGGSGSNSYTSGDGSTFGGAGGAGGGFVLINSASFLVSGVLEANGANGLNANGHAVGSGGAGAGGAILLTVNAATIGSSLINAIGGTGGYNPGSFRIRGGDGGSGRIYIQYCESLSGSTNPTAITQKPSCHVVEQIESSPFTQGRLNLPDNVNGSLTYKVQYGRKLDYGGATNQVTTLRVPAGMFSSATVQALVSGLSSSSWFALDIGNTGTDHWSSTVTNASQNTSPDLSAQFNAYWASHGAPTTGYLDVPVRVYLGGPGQVLLTNLQVQTSSSALRYIRIPARNYSNVTANLTVGGGGSGPMTIAADIGDKGSIDWSYTGIVAFPYTTNTSDLSSALNAYLTGKNGDVDVPIRFFVSPASASVTLNNFSATPTQLPDAAIVAPNVAFSSHNIVEADNVTVALTISNTGGSELSGMIASLSGIVPGGGLTYIGSTLVPVIAASGTASVNIPWNTLGFTGNVPVRVTLDPYNRVSETSKINNVVSTTVNILSRPLLDVVSLTLSDDEPVVGEPVTVTLSVRNLGQTAAVSQTTALYQGNPDAGALAIDNRLSPALPGSMTTTLALTWVPTTTGTFRLFARVDKDQVVNQPDRSGNDAWRDVFVGFRGPILLDSGAASDVPYSPATGYGYVDVGLADATASCGAQPYQSLRIDPGGRVMYQFDNLQPHHFYHLDVTLYRCGFSGRQELIQVNGNTVAGPENLGDGKVHRVSTLLDPALYGTRSISVAIQVTNSLLGALVSQVNLYDVDYRYSDSGGDNDPAYPGTRGFGWLNGIGLHNDPLPYRSQRMNQLGNQVSYRYDGLVPGKPYQLKFSFWQPDLSADVSEKIQVNGVDVGSAFTIGSGAVYSQVIDVPLQAYSSNGSITATVVRTDADYEAFVNEIALEELTAVLPPVPAFSASPTSGYAPLGVQFTDQSSGMITSRAWDFGDSYTDTIANPLHIYNAVGGYTVTLTTSGPGGISVLTRTNYITVSTVPPDLAVMRVTPASSSVAAGAPVTIGIELSNVTNLGSFQFTLGYNPALVEVQAVTLGDFLGSTGRTVFPTGPTISNTAGTVVYAAASLGTGIPGPSGKGTLALVRLVPHGSGAAVLHLSTVNATDVLGSSFNVASQDGTLNITSCLGDFNGNGVIDIVDVQRVAYRWNTNPGDSLYDPLYDLDGNGHINIVDVQIVAGRWNTKCSVLLRAQTPAVVASQSVTLSLQPLSQTMLAGQLFTVTVAISNVSDLGAFDISLGYSTSVVTVVSATLAGFPSSTGRQVYQTGPNIDAVNGTLALGAYSLGTTPAGPSGDGALAVVTLRAQASGQTDLTLLTGNVSDRTGNPETTALQSGTAAVAVTKMIYMPMVNR